MTPEVIISLVMVLAGSGGVAWFLAGQQKRKLSSDADKGNLEAVALFRQQLNELAAENVNLRDRLDDLEQETRANLRESTATIAQMRRQITAQTTHIEQLEAAMRAGGVTVPQRPF
jgi:cell division protein FtsB